MKKQANNDRHRARLIPALAGLLVWANFVPERTELASAQTTEPNWTYTGNLNNARNDPTATLLPNGKVLVVGGSTSGGFLNSAELYDPTTGRWSAAGHLQTPRVSHTATLLLNGKVLVAGGITNTAPPDFGVTNTAELYDPVTEIWSPTGNLNTYRFWFTATLLANGKVLVVGGANNPSVLDSAELYDPATRTWTLTGKPNAVRYGQTATLLKSGKVLIVGGSDDGDLASTLASAELYDPATGTWSSTGSLGTSRILHTATLLRDGKVLVAGGYNWPPTSLRSAELYDPANGTWSVTGSPIAARDDETATLLPNGNVLVAGGEDWNRGLLPGPCLPNCNPLALNSAELYEPNAGTWNSSANLNSARSRHTATLLQNGKALVAGGFSNTNGTLNSAAVRLWRQVLCESDRWRAVLRASAVPGFSGPRTG